MITNSNISRQGKGYTDSLSKEEIEKETSAVIDYYNAYVLNNIRLSLVTDELGKSAIAVDKNRGG